MIRILCSLAVILSTSLGFAKDPDTLIFAFQKRKNPADLQASVTKMAEALSKQLGTKVEILVPTSYSASVQGLISNKVHVAYMDSLPYVLAKKETAVEIIAVEKRNGRTDYDSLIIVKKDSPVKTLHDLQGKKMAFTSQTSTSGYLMPYSRLLADKELKNPKELEKFFTNVVYRLAILRRFSKPL